MGSAKQRHQPWFDESDDFKRTLFEEKQRAFNSLLSDPNLSQRRHIIKTLALNRCSSSPWMDVRDGEGDLSSPGPQLDTSRPPKSQST